MNKFLGYILSALYGAGLIYVDKSVLADPAILWKYQLKQLGIGG